MIAALIAGWAILIVVTYVTAGKLLDKSGNL